MDNIFSQSHMCESRQIKNASSVLRDHSLTWWMYLLAADKPQTWQDMKVLMQKSLHLNL